MGLVFVKVFGSFLLKNELFYFIIRNKISFYETRLLSIIHILRSVPLSNSVTIRVLGINIMYVMQYPWFESNTRVRAQPQVTVSFLSAYGHRDISI